jgi:hypothetical protein
MVAGLKPQHVTPLVAAFYIDADMMQEAIQFIFNLLWQPSF